MTVIPIQQAFSQVDEKFRIQGVYLFNVITSASTTEADFEEGNGLAAFVGYHFLPWLSVELGGLTFDPVSSFEDDGVNTLITKFEASGYTAGVKAVGSFYELFDYWAAAGIYSWESTFNYEIQYQNFPGVRSIGSDTNSGSDIYYRLGVSAPVTRNFSLTLEMSEFELNDFFSEVGGSGSNTDFKQRVIGFGLETRF